MEIIKILAMNVEFNVDGYFINWVKLIFILKFKN